MQWFVRLTGTSVDLEELIPLLEGSPLSLLRDHEGILLSSDGFRDVNDIDELLVVAGQYLSLLNGTARLVLGAMNPFGIAHVKCIKDDGTATVSVTITETLTLRGHVQVVMLGEDGPVEVPRYPRGFLARWIAHAERSERAAKALRLWGTGEFSWVNLYRIYELIRADLAGGKELENRGWTTRAAIDRFTASANHPDVAGDTARHGFLPGPPPRRTMELGEARAFVELLLHRWLTDEPVS